MQSLNFEILRRHCPQIADLGGFAELYTYSDPEGTATKLRKLGEVLTDEISRYYRLNSAPRTTHHERLKSLAFTSLVPQAMVNRLHALRMTGNDSVHPDGRSVTSQVALARLMDAHHLAEWWALTALAADVESLRTFQKPEPHLAVPPEFAAKLKDQECLLDAALKELENLKSHSTTNVSSNALPEALRRTSEESARILCLIPDENGIVRGVRLFRFLAKRANQGVPTGISYGNFIAHVHAKNNFREVVGRNYLPGDSRAVIAVAASITRENGGRIAVSSAGRTIQSGMDTFIWSSSPPYERSPKAWQNPSSPLPYNPAEWRYIFPDGLRRLSGPGETPQ